MDPQRKAILLKLDMIRGEKMVNFIKKMKPPQKKTSSEQKQIKKKGKIAEKNRSNLCIII